MQCHYSISLGTQRSDQKQEAKQSQEAAEQSVLHTDTRWGLTLKQKCEELTWFTACWTLRDFTANHYGRFWV